MIFISGTVLNLFFSTAVHGLLTREITRLSLLPIGDCLASLFSSRQHMMLYLCLQGFVCVLAVMFFLTNMRPYESDLDTITPEIKTPKAVGQYQHGSARWMSDAEKGKAFSHRFCTLLRAKFGRQHRGRIHTCRARSVFSHAAAFEKYACGIFLA